VGELDYAAENREPEGREIFTLLHFVYDAAKARALVVDRAPNTTVAVKDAARWFGMIKINKPWAEAHADLTIPVIGVVRKWRGEHFHFIIDGWHRLWRAQHEKVELLPMHMLSSSEEKKIRLR
jgi:hypothetical protein